jgi:long-subunit fatty acid transport protein
MRNTILTSILLMLMTAAAHGQSKTGTTVGQFLLIEPSARMAAMGNAGVALADGIQSVYYNPGALGQLEGTELQVTHSEWFAGINYDYIAAAMPLLRVGNAFASVTVLDSGEIDVRTVDEPLGTGERYTARDLAIGLGFGSAITERFSAGIQVNYIDETIWHSTLRVMTLNLGTVYRLTETGVKLGASISNYGTTARYDGRDLAIQYDNDESRYGDNSALPGAKTTDKFPVPVLFRVGITAPRKLSETSRILLSVDGFHPSDNSESVGLGAEWCWKDSFSLRGGYQSLFMTDSEVGLTFGGGLAGSIGERRFRFDYAWADQGRLQETHRMTLALAF